MAHPSPETICCAIDDGVYQGSYPDTLPSSISAIVTLTSRFEYPGRPRWVRAAHFWFPIPDGPFPGVKWLGMVVGAVEAARAADHKVLIHCMAGWSRSVLVSAAYLMKKYGYDAATALDIIKAENPKANPAPAFVAGLAEWDRYLHQISGENTSTEVTDERASDQPTAGPT